MSTYFCLWLFFPVTFFPSTITVSHCILKEIFEHIVMYSTDEPWCKKTTIMVYADSEDPDQLQSDQWHLCVYNMTLRKHTYSYILKILQPKKENLQIKNWYFSYFCSKHSGYLLEPRQWGSFNEYPQSMFLSKIRKNNVYACKPQFYYIKVGFKGAQIYIGIFVSWSVDIFLIYPWKPNIEVLIRSTSWRPF